MNKIPDIVLKLARLADRVEKDNAATQHDVLTARELVNQYIDALEELEETAEVPAYMTGDEVVAYVEEKVKNG